MRFAFHLIVLAGNGDEDSEMNLTMGRWEETINNKEDGLCRHFKKG